MVDQRLCEIVFDFSAEELRDYLNKMGYSAQITEDNELLVYNPFLNTNAGLVWDISDYSTRGAMLGFIFAGGHWPHLFPTLMDKIKDQWSKIKKN